MPVVKGSSGERHRCSGGRSCSSGQSVAELAIVLPVLALLLMSILQIGFLLYTQVGVINAAREAARNAAAIPVVTASQATTAAAEYYTRLTDPTSGFLKRNVGGYSSSRLVTTGSPRTMVCYYSFTDSSGAPAVMARVEVEYSHPLFIPLISPILDGFDGTSDGGLRLEATEDIRVGNLALKAGDTDIGGIGSPSEVCAP